MDSQTCETCKHYIQHYYLDSQYAGAVWCGHCMLGRRPHKKPNAPACNNYVARTTEPKLPNRAGVIRYLTTDFLEKLLQMELPPEIRKI